MSRSGIGHFFTLIGCFRFVCVEMWIWCYDKLEILVYVGWGISFRLVSLIWLTTYCVAFNADKMKIKVFFSCGLSLVANKCGETKDSESLRS